MGFKGSVESFSLADVFQNLAMNQQTGTLHVFAGEGEEKFIHFQNGQVRFLSKGAHNVLLPGEVFHARGLVSPVQLAEALERQKETSEPIGAVLLSLSHIDRPQFDDVARHQMEEEIFDLFGWDKAQFEFNEGDPAPDMFADQAGVNGPTLQIAHLIMEAARRVDEWDRLRGQVPNYKEIYFMELAVRKAIEKGEMETDAVERHVASLIDGARDVEDLIADSFLFKFEVLAAMGGFVQSTQLVRPATVQELAFAEQECLRMGAPRRRVKVLERILAIGGESARVRRDLAELLAKEGQVDKACIHFSVLADAELQARREDGAIEFNKRILSIAPKYVKAHEQLGAIYAKRGQKREAYIHYQELYETLRDQNHTREARAAATSALECDTTQTDMRNALVELLLAENQKEAASQQLELLGDQGSKQGNMKMAADAYRRAMQYRPANKQIKKKLADVMLSREDKVAKKRNALVFVVVVAIVGSVVGALALKEMSNLRAFTNANKQARELADQAELEETGQKFKDAGNSFEQAGSLYAPLTNLFSPVMNYNEKARKSASDFAARAASMRKQVADISVKGGDAAKRDLADGDSAQSHKQFDEAREAYLKVIDSAFAPAEMKSIAEKKLAVADERINTFNAAMERLKNPVYEKIEDEDTSKRNLIADFTGYPKFHAVNINLPLRIKSDTNIVSVYMDGKLVGTVNNDDKQEADTFHYPFGQHRFEFKKSGYKTIALNTPELRSPVFDLHLKREPAVTIDLRPNLLGVALSGEAVLDGNTIFVGTAEGSLLQVFEDKRVRRWDPVGGGNLKGDIYGPIYVMKRANKPDIVVFSTRIGKCIGLSPSGDTFVQAWDPVDLPDPGLTERPRPAIMLLNSKPTLVLPIDKRLFKLDCETGLLVQLATFKTRLTSSPALGEKNTIVIGGEDSVLFGFTAAGDYVKWNTSGAAATAITGQPILIDNQIAAGGNDGKLYFFDSGNQAGKASEVLLKGEILCQPLPWNRRLYVGSSVSDSVWCVDIAAHMLLWPKSEMPAAGAVIFSAAALDNRIYFGTETGRLCAVDAERGFKCWDYQLENKKAFTGSPLINGRMVYIVTQDGRIIGFDEPRE